MLPYIAYTDRMGVCLPNGSPILELSPCETSCCVSATCGTQASRQNNAGYGNTEGVHSDLGMKQSLAVKHGNGNSPIYRLVGGFNPSEKYEFVNGKDDIPYIMENKTCLKPPAG